jgi:ParB family transcriptional regulator, chromosome partitioning protein
VPKRGLPDSLRMRHDAHYVETLAAPSGAPVGRMVPIESVDPNPDQPRQAMGDLSELIASVGEKGIIEPLVVRQKAWPSCPSSSETSTIRRCSS